MNIKHFLFNKYFGIGIKWSHYFINFLGILNGVKYTMLFQDDLEQLLSFFLLLQKKKYFLIASTLIILLKKYTEHLFLNTQSYIVKRHKQNYPIHGQRRHSNHSTVRKFKGSLIF